MRWQVHPVTNFLDKKPAWDVLNLEAGDLPFLRSDFLLPALEEFGTGREYLAVADEGGTPVAMGIFRRVRHGFWETFQPSQLPLGAFVSKRGLQLDVALGALEKALPGIVLGVALTQQDPTVRQRPATGATLETLDYVDTACVRVKGTFDGYWASRGKNLRQNVKKQIARLAQEGVEAKLEVIDDPANVAEAIAQYGKLESAGWKAEGGTAISADNAQGRFYRAVFESFCSRGSGRIYCFSINGKVVAMDLCLVGGGALVILKTTYDESLKSISPAVLMRHRYLESLFAEKAVDRIEFYGKVMEWHLRWTDEVRTLFHVNHYRWRWVRGARSKLRLRSTSLAGAKTPVADSGQGSAAM